MTINQQQPMPPEVAEIYSMISNHVLPEPSCTSPSGEAAWTVDGLAKLFDLNREDFIKLMRSRGAVYAEQKGIPSSWPMLLEG
jgi:hypothetical protein